MNNLPCIQQAELHNKVVLVRVDHNVVKKGIIHDPYRIDATIGTLFYLTSKGAKLILMSHVGRPKDKQTGTIRIDENTSVKPIVDYLYQKLHIQFTIPELKSSKQGYKEDIALILSSYIADLKENKLDGIYLPNTRWFYGEEGTQDEKKALAQQLSSHVDIFINDAFGSWQPHASTLDITNFLPSYAGFLMQKEIKNLSKVFHAPKPFVAVVAGSKFSTKINSLYALVEKADYLILGGVIYNAYLCAKYNIKIKGIGEDEIILARKFVDYTQNKHHKIVELPYIIESDSLENKNNARCIALKNLKAGDVLNYVLDISTLSFKEENIKNIFLSAKCIFINAVMGLTPIFNEGTVALDELSDQNTEAVKLYGGGDTLQELKRLLPGLYITAIDHPKYYIFTGGGAVLKAIENNNIEGLEPIKALLK